MVKYIGKIVKWIWGVLRKWGLTFALGIGFAVVCFVGLNTAMKGVSKAQYCGSKCHEMNTAYQSWELSVHGANKFGIRVECVSCHMPSKDNYFTHITTKAYLGGKDIYKHHFGGKYDIEKMRKKVVAHIPNERCLSCHNDLLGKPGSSVARMVHTEILNNPDAPESRCVECHDDVGHNRQATLFSP